MAFELIFGDGVSPSSTQVFDILMSLNNRNDIEAFCRDLLKRTAGGDETIKNKFREIADLERRGGELRKEGRNDEALTTFLNANAMRCGYTNSSLHEIIDILVDLHRPMEAYVYTFIGQFCFPKEPFNVDKSFPLKFSRILMDHLHYRPIFGYWDEHQLLTMDDDDFDMACERLLMTGDLLEGIPPKTMFYLAHILNHIRLLSLDECPSSRLSKRLIREFVLEVEQNEAISSFLTKSNLATMTLEQLTFLTHLLRLFRKLSKAVNRSNVVHLFAPDFFQKILNGLIGQSFVSKQFFQRTAGSLHTEVFNRLHREWAIFAFWMPSEDRVEFMDQIKFSVRHSLYDFLWLTQMATSFLFTRSKFTPHSDDEDERSRFTPSFYFHSAAFYWRLIFCTIAAEQTVPSMRLERVDEDWKKAFALWSFLTMMAFGEAKLATDFIDETTRFAKADIKAMKPWLGLEMLESFEKLQKRLFEKYHFGVSFPIFTTTQVVRLRFLANHVHNLTPKKGLPAVTSIVESLKCDFFNDDSTTTSLLLRSQKVCQQMLEAFGKLYAWAKCSIVDKMLIANMSVHFVSKSWKFAELLLASDDCPELADALLNHKYTLFLGTPLIPFCDTTLVRAAKGELVRRRFSERSNIGLTVMAIALARNIPLLAANPNHDICLQLNALLSFQALFRQPPLVNLRLLPLEVLSSLKALRIMMSRLKSTATGEALAPFRASRNVPSGVVDIYRAVGSVSAVLIIVALVQTDHRCKKIYDELSSECRQQITESLKSNIDFLSKQL